MGDTSIEWTKKTWNPIRGCSRVSAGCKNCYAMRQAHRSSNPGGAYHGLTTIRRGKVDWAGMARFIPEQLSAPLRWRIPRKVFVNSMSDLFHESLSNEEIAAIFGIMAIARQHTYQVLTKRIDRALEWFDWIDGGHESADEICRGHADLALINAGLSIHERNRLGVFDGTDGWPLPNVWLGVSVENQKAAGERIPLLLQCPATIRWISAEPLLGALDISLFLNCCPNSKRDDKSHGWEFDGDDPYIVCHWCGERRDAITNRVIGSSRTVGLDWVVIGGESGNGARPFDLSWASNIVHDCEEAGVPVFVKQLGRYPFDTKNADDATNEASHDPATSADRILEIYKQFPVKLKSRKGAEPVEWSTYLRKRQFPEARAA